MVALWGAGDCERGYQTSALGLRAIQIEKPGASIPLALCVACRATVAILRRLPLLATLSLFRQLQNAHGRMQ